LAEAEGRGTIRIECAVSLRGRFKEKKVLHKINDIEVTTQGGRVSDSGHATKAPQK